MLAQRGIKRSDRWISTGEQGRGGHWWLQWKSLNCLPTSRTGQERKSGSGDLSRRRHGLRKISDDLKERALWLLEAGYITGDSEVCDLPGRLTHTSQTTPLVRGGEL
ncbi:hypothetical protein B0H17DRAFT_1144485 [Mycena rosella]|uniref:Uncharacterized protein n=1 Tax=Mycena rosella TaxID=1033263 RepID=A0AAD7CWM7_MYCRO|nr:hypothetical protein B0H17DRAFT_1144485 [Mycena rosella]